MSKLNICIIIICFLLFIIVYLLCNNKLDNIVNFNKLDNIVNFNEKKLYGGVEENNINNINNINNEIKNEQARIDAISNELESMKVNKTDIKEKKENNFGKIIKRPGKDDIELNQQENNTFIMRLMDEEKNNKKTNNNKRVILDDIENTNMIAKENEGTDDDEIDGEIDDEIDGEIDEEELKNTPVKAWDDMCKKDVIKEKKKTQFDDLKLNLNNSSYLEPFNEDDFSEFGKFNC